DSGSWLFDLRFLLRLRCGDFFPGRRAPEPYRLIPATDQMSAIPRKCEARHPPFVPVQRCCLLERRQIPQLDSAVVAAGSQGSSVTRKSYIPHGARVPTQELYVAPGAIP